MRLKRTVEKESEVNTIGKWNESDMKNGEWNGKWSENRKWMGINGKRTRSADKNGFLLESVYIAAAPVPWSISVNLNWL